MSNESSSSFASQNDASVSSEYVAELIDLFQRNKHELCQDWAEAMDRDHLMGAQGVDDLLQNCEVIFDSYVEFVRTQSKEDQDSLSEVLKSQLGQLRPEVNNHVRATLKIGQRQLHDILTKAIVRHGDGDIDRTVELLDAYQRRAYAIAVEGINLALEDREVIIREQRNAIRELSTPVLQVRELLLICPLIGIIDQDRARQIMEQLLRRIRESRALGVVIDITGIPIMDAHSANSLVQTVLACRLVGAFVVVCGVSPEIARTLVQIGVDLNKMDTTGDLQGAIEEAELRLGYRWTRPRQVNWSDEEEGDA